MAFKPKSQQRYYVLPKRSNRPLGVEQHDYHQGLVFQEQDMYPNNAGQQFEIRPSGNGEYHLMVCHSGMVADVRNGAADREGQDLIQYGYHGGTNQRFRPIYAGDGYYYLMPAYGKMVLGVANDKSNGWNTVRQSRPVVAPHNNGHQLFRLVPTEKNARGESPLNFRQYSDQLRTVAGAAAGLAAAGFSYATGLNVGWAVKGVMDVLWPDGHDQDFWNQVTRYVDERINAALDQAALKGLNERLKEVQKRVTDLLAPEFDDEYRREELSKLFSDCLIHDGGFLAARTSPQVLPYLVAWGTLVLSIGVDAIATTNRLLAAPDCDETERKHLTKRRDGAKTDLTRKLNEYQQAVQDGQAAALEWRKSQVQVVRGPGRSGADHRTYTTFAVEDQGDKPDYHTPWRTERQLTEQPGQPSINPRAEAIVHYLAETRQQQVARQYAAELEVMLAPSLAWEGMRPDRQPAAPPLVARPVTVAVGPYGGVPNGKPFRCEGNGGIAWVTLHSHPGERPHPYLCGLTVWFTNGHIERVGMTKGQQEQTALLGGGVRITGVQGYEHDLLEGLSLETSRGQCATGGRRQDGTWFSAGLADALEPRLVGISGHVNNNFFTALTFHWEYDSWQQG